MPIPSLTLPSDDTTADVADYNVPILALLAAISALDDDNIASVSGSKITAGTTPITALDASSLQGYVPGGATLVPSSIAYNGNRQYTLTYGSSVAAIKSVKMRNKFTRTVAAPTQVTALSGTKYWSKATPNKFSWTDDFTIDVVINPTSYALGTIVSCYNGTSGWALRMNANGQIQLVGYNAGAANYSQILSYHSVELNRETRITAELDMSGFTNSATTSYIMFDGKNMPGLVSRGGTNPTALVQAGNLNVGAENGGTNPFQGNISQLAIFNAKVTQATIRTYHGQKYAGTETSIASAYSFDGVATDLNTTTPNDLSAQNSAGYATGGYFGNHGTSSTVEYAITTSVSTDGLTETVFVPEGCALPTSGGIASVSYSRDEAPHGFVLQQSRWDIRDILKVSDTVAFSGLNTWALWNVALPSVPIGDWEIGYQVNFHLASSVAGTRNGSILLASSTPTNATYSQDLSAALYGGASTTDIISMVNKSIGMQLTTPTSFSLYAQIGSSTGSESWKHRGDLGQSTIYAKFKYL